MSSETVEPQNKTKQKQAINAKPTGLQKLKLLGEMFVLSCQWKHMKKLKLSALAWQVQL